MHPYSVGAERGRLSQSWIKSRLSFHFFPGTGRRKLAVLPCRGWQFPDTAKEIALRSNRGGTLGRRLAGIVVACLIIMRGGFAIIDAGHLAGQLFEVRCRVARDEHFGRIAMSR